MADTNFDTLNNGTMIIRYRSKNHGVLIPGKAEVIAQNAFKGCTQIHSVSDSTKSKLWKICTDAFANCLTVEKIYLWNSPITAISKYAFNNCCGLKRIYFTKTPPTEALDLGLGVFESCSNLEEIVLPDNCHTIRATTFAYCKKLRNVYLGPNIDYIDDTAFVGCEKLQLIAFKDRENIKLLDKGLDWLKGCPNIRYLRFGNIQLVREYAHDTWILDKLPDNYTPDW